jgi:hypothetical protein
MVPYGFHLSKLGHFFCFGGDALESIFYLLVQYLGVFRETKKHFLGLFRFVLVVRTGIETTKTNRIFLKQTETNRKISNKTSLLGGPRNC